MQRRLNLTFTFLAVTGLIHAWQFYVSAFMSASFNIVGAPSRNAMVPGLVPREMLLNALLGLVTLRRGFRKADL